MPTPEEFVERFTSEGNTEKIGLVLDAYPQNVNMKILPVSLGIRLPI